MMEGHNGFSQHDYCVIFGSEAIALHSMLTLTSYRI